MESYSWPKNLPTYRKRAIEELIRGREFTNQLQSMLTKTVKGEEGSMFPEDLVMKILESFTETLSILKSTDSDEVSQFPAGLGCRKYEDSGESSKTSVKDRRGCYKRRKTSQTTTKLTPTLIDDGFAWRKYGQKSIHNTNHPRNYYRCTHKFDQGCQATKQVQRTEDDRPMYRTTYHGHHTCRSLLKSPQIILDPTAKDSSFLLSFGTNDPTHEPDGPFFPIIKQESKEGVQNLVNQTQSPPSNYLMSPDLTTFDSYGPMLSSGSDHGDVISSGVYSCTTSTGSLEMDNMMLGSGDFDDLQFDFV